MPLSPENPALLKRQLDSYLAKVYTDAHGRPLALPDQQRQDVSLAFYAGARAFFRGMSEVSESGEPTHRDMLISVGLIEELEQVVPDMKAGRI